MWKFKKHILKTADSQAAPSCPDRAVVIQVCNQNSAKDDNFDVYLNGSYIGFLDLSQDAQVGSVIIATTNTSANVLVGDFACPLTLMQTYRFNPSLLLFGPNTLEMRNVQINNNGNAGTVSIRNYEVVDNDLINPCVIADLTYGGADGASFTMVFNYTACCPGELDETIIAVKDTYTTTFGAGLSGANILVNDSLNGNSVTISNVLIRQVYTSNPLVSINTTTGEIVVATNTPIGEYTLVYEICEVGNPSNCDQTTIKVIVTAATTTTTTTTAAPTTTTTTTTTAAPTSDYRIRSFVSANNISQVSCDSATYYDYTETVTFQLTEVDGTTPKVNLTGANIVVNIQVDTYGCFSATGSYSIEVVIPPGQSSVNVDNTGVTNNCGGRECTTETEIMSCYTSITPSTVLPTGQFYPLCAEPTTTTTTTTVAPTTVRLDYQATLSGGTSFGTFNILVNGNPGYSTNATNSGYIDVPVNSTIEVNIYAPPGVSEATFNSQVFANNSSGSVGSDSGPNASATITFVASEDTSIVGTATTSGSGGTFIN